MPGYHLIQSVAFLCSDGSVSLSIGLVALSNIARVRPFHALLCRRRAYTALLDRVTSYRTALKALREAPPIESGQKSFLYNLRRIEETLAESLGHARSLQHRVLLIPASDGPEQALVYQLRQSLEDCAGYLARIEIYRGHLRRFEQDRAWLLLRAYDLRQSFQRNVKAGRRVSIVLDEAATDCESHVLCLQSISLTRPNPLLDPVDALNQCRSALFQFEQLLDRWRLPSSRPPPPSSA